jgi:general secretion pathway protein G
MRKSFTLIELLIVVAIIGILAAISAPVLKDALTRAKISRAQADIRTTADALEAYRLDWNAYPRDGIVDFPLGWSMLTTPVAYIPLPPIDVFTPKRKWHTSGGYLGMGTDTPYEGSPIDVERYSRSRGTWILLSSGPDYEAPIRHTIHFWPWNIHLIDFDISNGLYSRGDINKIGGNYRNGYYRRNFKYYGTPF